MSNSTDVAARAAFGEKKRIIGLVRTGSMLAAVCLLFAVAAFAQSPNTGAIAVTVVDQNGALVPGASISVTNVATGTVRDAVSGGQGSATFAALSLTGEYKVSVAKSGFTADDVTGLKLRAGETATVRVKLTVSGGTNEVTVFGTTEGVRDNPQIGLPLKSEQIDETPILGRKATSLPLLNAAFRQGKGTGDLFVNATYFITGVGSRRATTTTLDGANNDEAWGRQIAITTLPLGSIQEMTVLTNSFSSEFGWTSGAAVNIVTKSGTNNFHGEGLVLVRPGGWQADSFSTGGFCPDSVPTCTLPPNLQSIGPIDIPDKLQQYSGTFGGPIIKDRTFFFLSTDYTRQNRTTYLNDNVIPSYLLPADGSLDYTGRYRQTLFNGRLDHRATDHQNLMFRFNLDTFYDDNPQDTVGGNNAPTVSAEIFAKNLGHAVQPHMGDRLKPAQRGTGFIHERRPCHKMGTGVALNDVHPRRCRQLYDRTVTFGGPVRTAISVFRYSLMDQRQTLPADGRQHRSASLGRIWQRIWNCTAGILYILQQYHGPI